MAAIDDYLSTYYDQLDPLDFYREIFPVGELQIKGDYQQGVYNGILVAVTKEKKADGSTRIRRYTVTDDLDVIRAACRSDDFCLMAPISYAGKNRSAENARYIYAIAVDLDRIRFKDRVPVGLKALIERHIETVERIPKPTYIVSSGTGVHLYYRLDRPIALFEDTAKQLQAFKHELTTMIWHDTICNISNAREIQQEGIYQGFRVPGTITKTGSRARVYRYGNAVSMDYLNSFVKPAFMVDFTVKPDLSLAVAKQKYPQWYDRRIVRKQPPGSWHVSRRIYEWWKQQILSGATVGHRYYCLMMLAIYARKCSMRDDKHNPDPVTREQLEQDAWKIMEFLESLTLEEDNHFTTDDVMQALQAFDERWIRYPRKAIEYRSGIIIPPNKRNHRKQADHIKLMNYVRDELNGNKHWQGRPTAMYKVEEWKQKNPGGSISECIKQTKLARSTVYKWWNHVDKVDE